jgi:hypothetical protein
MYYEYVIMMLLIRVIRGYFFLCKFQWKLRILGYFFPCKMIFMRTQKLQAHDLLFHVTIFPTQVPTYVIIIT